MAKPSIDLVIAIRNTIRNLKTSNNYQWGHMGCCNCGFLAQEITKLRKDEIHSRAMQGHGDWTEQLNDYCAESGMPMDEVITLMLEAGLDSDDLKHLERLSCPVVLRALPASSKNLKHNIKEDVITYFDTWAMLMEKQLLTEITLQEELAKKEYFITSEAQAEIVHNL
jgi:hypothetical protein